MSKVKKLKSQSDAVAHPSMPDVFHGGTGVLLTDLDIRKGHEEEGRSQDEVFSPASKTEMVFSSNAFPANANFEKPTYVGTYNLGYFMLSCKPHVKLFRLVLHDDHEHVSCLFHLERLIYTHTHLRHTLQLQLPI